MVDMNCITRDVALGEVLVGRFEALALVVGAHKGLDQPRPGDVLLQDGVQPVQLLLHAAEQRLHLDAEERRSPTEVTSSSGSMVSARLRLVLNIRIRLPIISSGARVPMRSEIWTSALDGAGVAGQAHHQLAGGEAVEVAVGEGLDLEEQRLAQVAGHAFAHLDREDVVADGDSSVLAARCPA